MGLSPGTRATHRVLPGRHGRDDEGIRRRTSRDIIISTTGWDINPRALGIVPKEAKIQTLKGFHWVSDAFFMCVPKGVPKTRLAVVLDMMAHVLTPKMQAYAYDEGYLYPARL